MEIILNLKPSRNHFNSKINSARIKIIIKDKHSLNNNPTLIAINHLRHGKIHQTSKTLLQSPLQLSLNKLTSHRSILIILRIILKAKMPLPNNNNSNNLKPVSRQH